MADVTNVAIGPCNVSINGVDVGHTIGGAEVAYSPSFKDIMVDKYGDTVVEKALIGEGFKVKFKIAESTMLNFKKAIPLGTLAGGDARLTIGKEAGELLSASAYEVVLHPNQNLPANLADDVVLYKAVCVSEIVIPYRHNEERVFEVEFAALIDETKSDGSYLGLIGDSTA